LTDKSLRGSGGIGGAAGQAGFAGGKPAA
jgi:hypothetical protein